MLKHIPETYEIIGKIGSGKVVMCIRRIIKPAYLCCAEKGKNRASKSCKQSCRSRCTEKSASFRASSVYDFLEVDGDVYTVMTFVEGNSFGQYLDSGREFEEKSVIIWRDRSVPRFAICMNRSHRSYTGI